MESVVFPVILYDGERETDVGSIKINPMLNFKQFQMMLKENIGISYNNLTTYLVDSDKSVIPSERRKILITGKVNFSVLVQEKNCYFLVVLKRSRRDRRKRPNNKQSGLEFAFAPPPTPPEYLMNMRRKHLDLIDEQIASVYGSYDGIQENYINAVKWNQLLYQPVKECFWGDEEAYSAVEGGGSRALCMGCSKAEKQGRKAAFHFCIYDKVVLGGFRSTVGPICPPR